MSWSEPSEDLEFNLYYQAIQTRYVQQYDHAQQNCWLVCIPRAVSLTGCSITRSFVDMHMLQPSRYLKDHYSATCNGQKLEWQLRGEHLECVSSSGTTLTVPVLSEELAYNRQLQQFKMFIIDRPLDPNYKPSVVRGNHFYATKTRRKFEEHVHFLKSFEKHREPLRDLEYRISVFLENYLIVEQESLLGETASKLEATTKQAHIGFMEANRGDGRLNDRRVHDAVWLSLESYLMEKVHSKVFPAVCRVHKRQNDALVQRCKYLRDTITPSLVGVSSDYDCPYSQTLIHLNRLEDYRSPLEQLYCLQDAMESIQQDAREHFTKTLRHGEPDPLASDDLIALLATILTQSNCAHMYSTLYYMENYHWPPSDTDKLSYVLVTFHAAMEYIRGPGVAHLLPKSAVVDTGVHFSRNKKLENNRERSLSPCPPSPLSSSSLSTLTESSASLDGHREDKTLPSTSPKRNLKKASVKHAELGPFLSLLAESEETISSTSWDPYS